MNKVKVKHYIKLLAVRVKCLIPELKVKRVTEDKESVAQGITSLAVTVPSYVLQPLPFKFIMFLEINFLSDAVEST
jgi:hypothetical protein